MLCILAPLWWSNGLPFLLKPHYCRSHEASSAESEVKPALIFWPILSTPLREGIEEGSSPPDEVLLGQLKNSVS